MSTAETAPPSRDADVWLNQFIVGGGDAFYSALQDFARTMSPLYFDDFTLRMGYDVYRKMMRDDDVRKAMRTRILAVVSQGIRITPAEGADKNNPDDVRNIYAEFVKRAISDSETAMEDVAKGLLSALAYGSKIGEVVYKPGVGEDAARLVLADVKVRNNTSFDYVVMDERLLGVAPKGMLTEEKLKALREAQGNNPELLVAIHSVYVPRWKIVHFANEPEDGSVLGCSELEAAYTPWYMKTQVIPDFYRYLKQFVLPGIIGFTPTAADLAGSGFGEGRALTELAQPTSSADTESFARKMLTALLAWQNAFVAVLPGGSKIEKVQSEGNGEAFRHAMAYFGDQITAVILGTAQATNEARRESRSSKDVAQDVVGLRIANDQRVLGRALTRDIVRPLIWLNFGPDAVKFAPTISLHAVEQQDWKTKMDAISTAVDKWVFEPQFPELHAEMGLPAIPEAFWQEREQQRQEMAQERLRILNPASDAKPVK